MNPSSAAHGIPQCVPLRTLILTRRGWLSYAEVQDGDEALGYNPQTGRSEWTPVLAVHHYDDLEMWRIGNKHWKADVTPNHRWWSDTRRKHRGEDGRLCGRSGCGHDGSLRGEFVVTEKLGSDHRLRLAAPADTDGIPGLSTEDCAVLGWLMSDGCVRKARGQRMIVPSRRDAEGRRTGVNRGKREWTDEDRGWDAHIYQSKPGQVVGLRALLARVPHTESVRQRLPLGSGPVKPPKTGAFLPAFAFHLSRGYVTDLLTRARWDDLTHGEFVLSLSPDQRASWLAAVIDAEGDKTHGYQPWHKDHVRIAQNDGPLLEAIKLAVYLEGFQPSLTEVSPGSRCKRVGLRSPHAALPGFSASEVLGTQPAWCVTTGLGTWTMRQEGALPCLTGNSGRMADPWLGGARGHFQPVCQRPERGDEVPRRWRNSTGSHARQPAAESIRGRRPREQRP